MMLMSRPATSSALTTPPARANNRCARSAAVALVLASTLAGSTIPVSTAAAAATTPPTLRWQTRFDPGGIADLPIAAVMQKNRVFVGGTAGGTANGEGSDAVLQARRQSNGKRDWVATYDTGVTETLTALAASSNTLFMVGTVDADPFSAPISSFVQAVRSNGGTTRWLYESTAASESLRGATVADGRLFVVGRADNKILVRAYRARTGQQLWEDNHAPEFAISESASLVVADGDRLYVVGNRDTVLGRTALYVARAYDAASGELLWESEFGTLVNSERGAQIVSDRLIVAGDFWEIGSGLFRMEVRGLDLSEGSVLWQHRPYRGFDTGSGVSTLVAAGDMAIVGGGVFRNRAQPVTRSYSAAGARTWVATHAPAQSGTIQALATVAGTVVATGTGSTRHRPPTSDLLVQGFDAATGAVEWTELLPLGVGDGVGRAIAVEGDRFAIAGTYERVAGDRDWIIRFYDR